MNERSLTGQPRAWLRAEGLMVLALSAILFARSATSWATFAILFFVPDLSFLAYLRGAKVGAALYNAVHSYVAPLAAILILVLLHEPAALPLVWLAHIGFDRALGYGLKYPSGFQDTHMGRIGKAPRAP